MTVRSYLPPQGDQAASYSEPCLQFFLPPSYLEQLAFKYPENWLTERQCVCSSLYSFAVFTKGRKFPTGIKPQGKRVQKKKVTTYFEWDLKVCFNKIVLFICRYDSTSLGEEEIKETHYFLSLSIVLQAFFKVPKGIKNTILGGFYPYLKYIWRIRIILKIPCIYNIAMVDYVLFFENRNLQLFLNHQCL